MKDSVMQIGDAVTFNSPTGSLAVEFCFKYGIAARVVSFDANNLIVVDAGLGYNFYVKRDNLTADSSFIPGLSCREDIKHLVPQPCDDM